MEERTFFDKIGSEQTVDKEKEATDDARADHIPRQFPHPLLATLRFGAD